MQKPIFTGNKQLSGDKNHEVKRSQSVIYVDRNGSGMILDKEIYLFFKMKKPITMQYYAFTE